MQFTVVRIFPDGFGYGMCFFFVLTAAVTELPSGEICDEINELRYCGRSLVCHKCPEDEDYKCVNCKYRDLRYIMAYIQ